MQNYHCFHYSIPVCDALCYGYKMSFFYSEEIYICDNSDSIKIFELCYAMNSNADDLTLKKFRIQMLFFQVFQNFHGRNNSTLNSLLAIAIIKIYI